jgi:hypothetical protein
MKIFNKLGKLVDMIELIHSNEEYNHLQNARNNLNIVFLSCLYKDMEKIYLLKNFKNLLTY